MKWSIWTIGHEYKKPYILISFLTFGAYMSLFFSQILPAEKFLELLLDLNNLLQLMASTYPTNRKMTILHFGISINGSIIYIKHKIL